MVIPEQIHWTYYKSKEYQEDMDKATWVGIQLLAMLLICIWIVWRTPQLTSLDIYKCHYTQSELQNMKVSDLTAYELKCLKLDIEHGCQ